VPPPYFQHHPIFADRAEGAWLTDTEGRRYIDFASSAPMSSAQSCRPRCRSSCSAPRMTSGSRNPRSTGRRNGMQLAGTSWLSKMSGAATPRREPSHRSRRSGSMVWIPSSGLPLFPKARAGWVPMLSHAPGPRSCTQSGIRCTWVASLLRAHRLTSTLRLRRPGRHRRLDHHRRRSHITGLPIARASLRQLRPAGPSSLVGAPG